MSRFIFNDSNCWRLWRSQRVHYECLTGSSYDAFKGQYGNKSEPSGDKSKYKPKAFYLERMADVRGQIYARLRAMTDADFNAPHPDPARRERFPTVGHMVMFYGTWHETYHAGQLSAWRRVQGLPPV